MPLSYPAGTLAEHRCCRQAAVAFDVSHLGTVRVRGDGARDLLQRTLTNDLAKIDVGRCQYTHLLDDNGGVADDIIVWWRDDEVFDVMPNASNTARVCDALSGGAVSAEDVTDQRAVIAVQGPTARTLLAAVMPDAAEVGRFRVTEFEFGGVTCVAAGTGYTGEDGVELAVPVAAAEDAWRAVLGCGIEPAGLGARDTLRLEAGLPLHGQELGPDRSPLNARLGWVVAWDTEFVGKEALAAQRDAGVSPLLHGLVVEGRRPPRTGQPVVLDGERIGEVSSGNFSPILETGIAMAFLDRAFEAGQALEVDARGTLMAARVVELPFLQP